MLAISCCYTAHWISRYRYQNNARPSARCKARTHAGVFFAVEVGLVSYGVLRLQPSLYVFYAHSLMVEIDLRTIHLSSDRTVLARKCL